MVTSFAATHICPPDIGILHRHCAAVEANCVSLPIRRKHFTRKEACVIIVEKLSELTPSACVDFAEHARELHKTGIDFHAAVQHELPGRKIRLRRFFGIKSLSDSADAARHGR